MQIVATCEHSGKLQVKCAAKQNGGNSNKVAVIFLLRRNGVWKCKSGRCRVLGCPSSGIDGGCVTCLHGPGHRKAAEMNINEAAPQHQHGKKKNGLACFPPLSRPVAFSAGGPLLFFLLFLGASGGAYCVHAARETLVDREGD